MFASNSIVVLRSGGDVKPEKAVKANTGSGRCPKDGPLLFAMVVAGQPHIAYESCGFWLGESGADQKLTLGSE